MQIRNASAADIEYRSVDNGSARRTAIALATAYGLDACGSAGTPIASPSVLFSGAAGVTPDFQVERSGSNLASSGALCARRAVPIARWLLALVVVTALGQARVSVHAQSPGQSNLVL